MPEEAANEKTVRRIYDECIAQGRLDVVPAIVAEDFVGPNGARGPAAFAATLGMLRTGFPDIRFTLDEVIAKGDRVVVRSTWKGTHTGTFRGWAPTGRAVTDTGIAIYRLAGGKIVSSAVETDRLSVLQQIGVIPEDLTTLRARTN